MRIADDVQRPHQSWERTVMGTNFSHPNQPTPQGSDEAWPSAAQWIALMLTACLLLGGCGQSMMLIGDRTAVQRARLGYFDKVCRELDRDYRYFGVAGVNPDELRARHRPIIAFARDDVAYWHALGAMLEELGDPHATVLPPSELLEQLTQPAGLQLSWIDGTAYVLAWPRDMAPEPPVWLEGADSLAPAIIAANHVALNTRNGLATQLIGWPDTHVPLLLEWADGTRTHHAVTRASRDSGVTDADEAAPESAAQESNDASGATSTDAVVPSPPPATSTTTLPCFEHHRHGGRNVIELVLRHSADSDGVGPVVYQAGHFLPDGPAEHAASGPVVYEIYVDLELRDERGFAPPLPSARTQARAAMSSRPFDVLYGPLRDELREVMGAIRALVERDQATATIFRLEENPGGQAEAAFLLVECLSTTPGLAVVEFSPVAREQSTLFRVLDDISLAPGDVVVQVDLQTEPDRAEWPTPIVVAIDSGTFSAAEALAAGLQSYAGATVVGTPTLGAGAAIRSLPWRGWEVSFGAAAMRHDDGRDIQTMPVHPDVPIQFRIEDVRRALAESDGTTLSIGDIHASIGKDECGHPELGLAVWSLRHRLIEAALERVTASLSEPPDED